MTAAELIRVLSRLPDDTQIYLQDESGWVELNFCQFINNRGIQLQICPFYYGLWLDHRSWVGVGNVHYSGFEYLEKKGKTP